MNNINPSNKNSLIFAGQQEDERVLCIIRPHFLMLLVAMIKLIIISALTYLIWNKVSNLPIKILKTYQALGFRLIWAGALIYLWWIVKYWLHCRSYVTDRRLVRFEAVFPVTEKYRSLFWREAAKTRGLASSFIWRLVKIGSVEISPQVIEGGGNITLPYSYYFEDLANYFDKIIHISKTSPSEIQNIKPFIYKPKWQRY